MAAVVGSAARFIADEAELAGDEEAGSGSREKAESKADGSYANDDKACVAVVRDVMVENDHGDAEAEEDEAGLDAEEDAAVGGAGFVFFDGDGFEEAAAGLVGGEGGESVGGVDALEDFFLEVGLGFGDEEASDGGEDYPDDPTDREADSDGIDGVIHGAPCVAEVSAVLT